MKEKMLQIATAVLLGLLLPGMVIRLSGPEIKNEFIQTAPSTQAQEEIRETGIWVLTADGTTQWMLLEEYVVGVILAEMPTAYNHQALCAQAVVARTYALKRQSGEKHPKGAVCTDPACCQAYLEISAYLDGLGFAEDVTVASRAVEQTQGMVVTYNDQLIEATYFHSSGGKTEEALAVWGVDLPYLQVVESPGEEALEDYSNRTFYTVAELERLLERDLLGLPGTWLGWTTYTPGGGVETIMLSGVQYTGTQLRSLLKLNSTAFTIEAESDGLWFTALGKGHRVGMSQTGAQAMALNGSSWQEILAHYYPGTRIDKMEDVQ